MEIRVKPSYRWSIVQAFSGREYTKKEFRPVPTWEEAAALADERFEVRQPAVKETVIVAPVVEPEPVVIPIAPEAYLFEEDPLDEIEEEIIKTVVEKPHRKRKPKTREPEA